MTSTTQTDNKINIDSWELSTTGEKLFSADAVIDAYLRGKKDQLEQAQKALVKQLETNIGKSATHTMKVLQYLNEKGMQPVSAHLKINSFDLMEILITLKEKDFLSDSITDVYDFISTFEDASSEELYRIAFSFTDEGADFNEALLKADGYVLKRDLAA